jgi:FOG: TPR repeat
MSAEAENTPVFANPQPPADACTPPQSDWQPISPPLPGASGGSSSPFKKFFNDRNKVILLSTIAACVVFLVALSCVMAFVVVPSLQYGLACEALEENRFDEAYSRFVSLGSYKDSSQRATDALKNQAEYLMNQGYYLEASERFLKLGEKNLYKEAYYRYGVQMSENGFYSEAANVFSALGDYSDCEERLREVQYLYGLELIKKWNYQKAIDIFTELDDYNDSKNLISQCYYKLGLQLLGKKAYEEAVVCFKTSGDSDRSQKRIKECYYNLGLQLLDKKNYEEAIEFFRLSGDYSDSEKRIKECYYNIGLQLLEEQSYSDAIEAFEKGGDFSDSKKRVKECYYNIGLQLLSEKSYDGAIAAFKKAGDFSDSKEKINAAKYAYVTEHKNNTDATTYKYLKELTSANYKDSKKIYTSLYAWKLTDIVFNTHRDDTSSNYTSFDKYDTIYFHASVSGGPPDGKTHIYCSIDWPDGSFTEKERLNTLFKAGDSLQLSFEQIYSDGPLYLEIFDDAGNLMGKGSVDVT